MSLFLHELIHLLLSLLTAFAIVYIFKIKKMGGKFAIFLFSIFGGFFIDVDHLFDYFFAFGPRFRLDYFLKGLQFFKTSKLFVPLHSFEIVIIGIIFSIVIYFFRKQLAINNYLLTIIFVFSLSLLFHLFFDICSNELPLKSYFFTYRLERNFDLKSLITADRYKNYLRIKKQIKF